MKSKLRHITVFCLTILMMVASTGFSVCCLFGCHSELAKSADKCCEEILADQPTQECPDCADEYVNLDVDYLTSSFDFKINIPVAASAQQPIAFPIASTSQKAIQLWELSLPPPPFGKELLPYIQSFRC